MAGLPTQTKHVATEGLSVQQASTGATGWNDFIDKVAKLSADENDGKPALSNLCQPERQLIHFGIGISATGW